MENFELLAERVGQGIIKLNPFVEDLVEKYGVEKDGIKVLVMGGIRAGGAGCACPANALLRGLLRHLVLEAGETVIVDLEAGVEHLGRATAQGVDALLVVVDPDFRSISAAEHMEKLAHQIGIPRILLVGNKIEEDEREFAQRLPRGLPPWSPSLFLGGGRSGAQRKARATGSGNRETLASAGRTFGGKASVVT